LIFVKWQSSRKGVTMMTDTIEARTRDYPGCSVHRALAEADKHRRGSEAWFYWVREAAQIQDWLDEAKRGPVNMGRIKASDQ
jgi:hypothetical protein